MAVRENVVGRTCVDLNVSELGEPMGGRGLSEVGSAAAHMVAATQCVDYSVCM